MKPDKLLSFLLVGLAWPVASFAQADINRSVISAGGGQASAGDIGLISTIGQPVAGVSKVGETALSAGFWHGSLLVEVPSGNAFEEWMASLPPAEQPPEGQRGPLDTPAGDGVANLLKFAFGLFPMESAADAAPRIVIDEEFGSLGIDFIRGREADVTFAVYGSDDLEIWVNLPHLQLTWDDSGLPPHREAVRLLTGLAAEDHPRYFLRLKVQVE